MVEDYTIMPMSVKVNGKELTLSQIAAIIVIISSISGGTWAVHEYFAKDSDMQYEKEERQRTDWTIQSALLDIKINTNTLLLRKLEENAPPTDPAHLKLYIQSLTDIKKKIVDDEAEKKAICEEQKAHKRDGEVVTCGNPTNISF